MAAAGLDAAATNTWHFFQDAADTCSNGCSAAWDGFLDCLSRVIEWGRDAFDAIAEFFSDLWEKVSDFFTTHSTEVIVATIGVAAGATVTGLSVAFCCTKPKRTFPLDTPPSSAPSTPRSEKDDSDDESIAPQPPLNTTTHVLNKAPSNSSIILSPPEGGERNLPNENLRKDRKDTPLDLTQREITPMTNHKTSS